MREQIKEIIIKSALMIFISLAIPYIFTTVFTGRVYLKNEPESVEITKKIELEFDGGTQLLDINEYIEWVLAYRVSDLYEYEMLKAQSVLIRTYIYKTMGDANLINESLLGLEYMPVAKQKELWKDDYINVYNYILCAINETENKCIYYEDRLIDAHFHFLSNGKTRADERCAYLQSVESDKDILAKNFVEVKMFSKEELVDVEILKRSQTDYVSSVRVGTKIYSGEEFAQKYQLASSCFYIENEENAFKITTKGKGHGFGMSLYGANKMAEEGKTFEEIISYYYINIQIKNE